jgi:multiple sugar transport system substrate-binding protein
MRKSIILGLIFSFVSLAILSCGTQKEKKVIKLAFWADRINRESTITFINEYNRSNPEVKVEYFPVEAPYERKLLTMIAGGIPPDIMLLSRVDLVEFAQRGMLLELDRFMEDDTSFQTLKKDIIPGLLDDAKYQEHYYAVPIWSNSVAMIYNRDMFDQEKLSYPNANWTWNDFLNAAKKTTKDINHDGKIDRFGCQPIMSTLGRPWETYMYIRQNDAQLFSPDMKQCLAENNEVKEAIRWTLDLQTKYHVAPRYNELAAGSYYTASQIANPFLAGKTAIAVCGRWWKVYDLNKLPFKWGIVPMMKGKRPVNLRSTICFGISKKTKYPEACWQFLKFATGKTGQEYILKTRSEISILYSNETSATYLNSFFTPEINKIFFDAVVNSESYPAFIGQYEWADYSQQLLDQVKENKMSLDAAGKKIAEKYQEIRINNKLKP